MVVKTIKMDDGPTQKELLEIVVKVIKKSTKKKKVTTRVRKVRRDGR